VALRLLEAEDNEDEDGDAAGMDSLSPVLLLSIELDVEYIGVDIAILLQEIHFVGHRQRGHKLQQTGDDIAINGIGCQWPARHAR